jgi:hypothetical protein
MNHIQLERNEISDSLALPDFPMDNAVDEEPNILPLQTIISPEDLRILQGQADESVTIQEALNVALSNVQNLYDERNAAMSRIVWLENKYTKFMEMHGKAEINRIQVC